jgi:transposase
VCKNPRIHHHKTFAGLARRGKTSTGWFYGFKLHLIVNDRGELLDFVLTPGNVDDRTPVPRLARGLFGKLFGDKGYLSKALRDELWRMFKVQLITGIRANMKNTLLPLLDKLLLRRRVIVETIVDQLKNISQIEHSRHRSPVNFVVNVLCGLIALGVTQLAGGHSGDEPSNGGWPPGGWLPWPHTNSPLSATDTPPAAKRLASK